MPLGMWVVVGWMAFVFLFGVALMGWGLATGQFDDAQEVACRMLADDEPQPWPRGERRMKEVPHA